MPERDVCELWKRATAMWIESLSSPADVSWNPAHTRNCKPLQMALDRKGRAPTVAPAAHFVLSVSHASHQVFLPRAQCPRRATDSLVPIRQTGLGLTSAATRGGASVNRLPLSGITSTRISASTAANARAWPSFCGSGIAAHSRRRFNTAGHGEPGPGRGVGRLHRTWLPPQSPRGLRRIRQRQRPCILRHLSGGA